MADTESVRQRIISSVFSRRNVNGGAEENYVSHVKIWEDSGADSEGLKPRYIILAQDLNGNGYIHKSKLNSNGSFSVGKTWKLPELRGIEVLNPSAFNITLARTYRWQTEKPNEQFNFLITLVKLFRSVAGGSASLQVIGLSEPDGPSSARQYAQDPSRHDRTPTPPAGAQRSSAARRAPTNQRSSTPSQDFIDREEPARNSSPLPGARSQSRARRRPSPVSSRPDSPLDPLPNGTSSARSQSTVSPMVPTPTARPPRAPRPSLTSSSRTSASSQVPSISLPSPGAPPPSRPSIVTSSLRSSVDSQSLSVSARSMEIPTSATSVASSTGTLLSAATTTKRSQSPSSTARSRSRGSSRGHSPARSDNVQQRRDQNARISFFDPANQTTLDRLILQDAETTTGADGEEESTQDILANVEEMLEGYEWASDDIIGRNRTKGAVDQIEARLLDELLALEKANIHSFIESDDRVGLVLKYLDEAILELDNMDSLVSSYKIHLNAVNDDISFIQSQNRGLQVQTQNQRALLNELENLLQTVQVDRDALVTLTQESLEKSQSIQRLEEASTELYKALLAGRDRDMAATMERLDEYRTHNSQFCKRLYDYLSIMFTAQASLLLDDSSGLTKPNGRGRVTIKNHQEMETYLGRYSGLILYLKEMDETAYGKLCAAYFSASSELHNKQISALFTTYSTVVKKVPEEDLDQTGFAMSPTTTTSRAAGGLRRAGTIVRSPLEGKREKDRHLDGDMAASEAFGHILEQVSPQIYREEEFIADFLQINEAALTFADYMGLENYFRRQATRSSGLSQQTTKLVRGAMDLIFGFLPAELKSWLDSALSKDTIQIIGITACLERFLADADERGNAFLLNFLDKQHTRLKALFDRHVTSQIKAVEETKLTSKKRNGVAHFIKYFPVYVGRVENQLIGADTLEIRQSVDVAYEKIVQTMFDSLKQMAKLDGEGEDKGQLNYHVILIENMHYFVAEIRQQEIGSVNVFSKRAESVYDENLNAYVKIVLRRPFAKIIDYFDGVERLLKTTAPTEVANNSSYSRSALKKIIKEYDAKDVRKHIDALYKRVEKHFTEASEKATVESGGIAPGTVMVGVWRACEEELLRITELFNKRISQCYAKSGVSLEYTAADVEAGFKRHRIGS
ncbi:exocyst complex component sec3 subunit [Artomyces pyxidatus]|uniref:Exocyst complex component sec3 subunit n=1 Tax=Artomyces pyxidatus TaxID=48021 RepID=A0ACB8TIJ9_9AGAM|nr:exocyst complex component sec3 subunit [Artomyces pyxidatus]